MRRFAARVAVLIEHFAGQRLRSIQKVGRPSPLYEGIAVAGKRPGVVTRQYSEGYQHRDDLKPNLFSWIG